MYLPMMAKFDGAFGKEGFSTTPVISRISPS